MSKPVDRASPPIHCSQQMTSNALPTLQKGPKLDRARQIPEWEEYDLEIAQFARELAAEGKIHSRMATADTNVLAGAGTGAANAEKGTTGGTAKPESGEHQGRSDIYTGAG